MGPLWQMSPPGRKRGSGLRGRGAGRAHGTPVLLVTTANAGLSSCGVTAGDQLRLGIGSGDKAEDWLPVDHCQGNAWPAVDFLFALSGVCVCFDVVFSEQDAAGVEKFTRLVSGALHAVG